MEEMIANTIQEIEKYNRAIEYETNIIKNKINMVLDSEYLDEKEKEYALRVMKENIKEIYVLMARL